MALIPDDKIAEIRDRTDIVQVIGEYVTLKKAGTNHKGLCPFHQEKTPSFNVSGPKQFFHCFGCGKSGDVFTFLTEVEGKRFVEVARDLAKRAGVDLPEPTRSREEVERAEQQLSERARLLRVNELALHYYREQLTEPAGQAARDYVDGRGIAAATQERFGIGFAPAGWEGLTRYLELKKVPAELAERAGLVRRRERATVSPGQPPTKQTHFDVFVERVVYPLTSPVGEVLGFGGRLLKPSDEQPKYKNSPETLLYKKGENLFGLHLAKHAIRRSGQALVVEGNFDVMTLHDRGIDFAVAPQGTAITAQQVQLLRRFAKEVVLMLDADPAGRAATLKVIHLFVEADLKLRVAQLRSQDGKKVDPDDLARNDLPRLRALIDQAVDAVEFFFDQAAASSQPTVPGKVAAVEECAPLLRAVRDPLARDLYIDRLAALLKIDVGAVRRALRGGPGPHASETRRRPEPAPAAIVDMGGEAAPRPEPPRGLKPSVHKLFALLAQKGELAARVPDDALVAVEDAEARALLAQARTAGALRAQETLALATPALREAVGRAMMSDEFAHLGDADPVKLLNEICTKLTLPSGRAALEEERRQALAKNDLVRVRELTAKILRSRIQVGDESR